MAVRDYLRVLARRWKIVVACLVLGVAVALVVSALSPRKYTATAELLVSAEATSNQTDLNQGSSFAQSRVKSYVAVVTSPDVLDRVRTDLSLPLSNGQLKSRLTATAQTDTTLISISATDTSSAQAASIANSAARAFATVIEDFETPADSATSAIKVLITTPALAPSSPQSPNVPVNAAIGLFLGILIGLSAAALRELLDVSIKAPEDLAATAGAPLLAAIVADSQANRQAVAAKVNARGPRAEGFRQLRTNLQFVDVDHPPRVISVNSAVPGEGKTATAINIAAALAESGARVCLIDADLRRPMIAEVMGLVSDVGLTSVLIGRVPLGEATQEVGTLRVLTSGPLPPNPSELLASNQTRELIRRVAADHDFVIVDTAPLLPVADGAEIAAAADGSILVARWGARPSPRCGAAPRPSNAWTPAWSASSSTGSPAGSPARTATRTTASDRCWPGTATTAAPTCLRRPSARRSPRRQRTRAAPPCRPIRRRARARVSPPVPRSPSSRNVARASPDAPGDLWW